MVKQLTLAEISSTLNVTFIHGAQKKRSVCGLAPLDVATEKNVSFLDNAKYKKDAKHTKAAAVFVQEQDAHLLPKGTVALITKTPYVAFAKCLQLFHPVEAPVAGISAHAHVEESATLHKTARIDAGVVVHAGAKIAARTHIQANTVIGQNVIIGEDCMIGSNVTILNATVGNRCLFHAGVCIGQDGFGFAQDGQHILKIPQVGFVKIGDDVELGAATTVDRGALTDTVIESGCKLDNQVQIAHNVHIGQKCRIAGQSGIAGSSILGNNVTVGGQCGIVGHVVLANNVMVAGKSCVTKSIDVAGSVVAGSPAVSITQWRKAQAMLARLAKGKFVGKK